MMSGTAMLDEKMHKAIAIMQFKLEGQLILAHPEYRHGGPAAAG